MPVLAVLCSAPAHLACFSALFGAQLYQSLVITKACFRALPRPAFVRLQRRLFPVYFRLQVLLVCLAAGTYPSRGPISLAQDKKDLVPFVVSGVAAVLNWGWYGPLTEKAMMENQGQQADPRTNTNEDTKGSSAEQVKKRFSKSHAMSIHINLISIISSCWHAWRLSRHMSFE